MLLPKRVKFRRPHRQASKLKGKATKGNKIAYGDYALQALEPAWITNRQIEAARIAMTRHVKRGGKILVCGATAGHDPKEDLRYIWSFELKIIGSNSFYDDNLAALMELIAQKKLAPVIDTVLPLDEAREGLRLIPGLRAEDFEVFEDGRPVSIANFSAGLHAPEPGEPSNRATGRRATSGWLTPRAASMAVLIGSGATATRVGGDSPG